MRYISTLFCILTLAITALIFGSVEASTLIQQRKQDRAQKQLDHLGKNKPATSGDTSTEPEEPPKRSLDGISGTTPREFALRFFSKDEREMMIPGFGRPAALMIILRQLDLSEGQVNGIKAVRRRIGNQMQILRQQHNLLENQLEEAIYGETFDPKRVEELSVLAGGKQAEIIKMQAGIESEFRQILTPDQFYVFRFLVGEMLLPQRRPQNRPLQQRRIGQPPP